MNIGPVFAAANSLARTLSRVSPGVRTLSGRTRGHNGSSALIPGFAEGLMEAGHVARVSRIIHSKAVEVERGTAQSARIRFMRLVRCTASSATGASALPAV